MKSTFISWMHHNLHSKLLARHVGATAHFICYGRPGTWWQAPLRYLVQAIRTWRTLQRERAEVVFVQNPPIFCTLLALLYAQRYHARYIIDSHSQAFLSPKWRWSLGIHRMLISDWPFLRDYFSLGTVHVPNTADGLCQGIQRAQREQRTLRSEILLLQAHLHAEWHNACIELQHILSGSSAVQHSAVW